MSTTTTATRSAQGMIEIAATPERIWKALTDATDLVRWFPLEAAVEPGEGGSVYMSWKNEYAGSSKILAWEPPRRLVVVWGWGEEKDRNPQMTEYRIEAHGTTTLLRVVTSGFPADPTWDDFVEGTNRGWVFELQSLKQYLEHHDGEDRRVVYIRHRIPMPAAAGWNRLFTDAGIGEAPFRAGVFDRKAPHQYAALVPDLGGALFRASCEPCMRGTDRRDVTLWIQAWGDQRKALDQYAEEWPRLLAQLFPEGKPAEN